MADEKKLVRAKAAYNTLCRALTSRDWKFDRNDSELTIECGVQGEDLPMRIRFVVDADSQLIRLFSHMPFNIAEDRRLDVAVAVSLVNNRLVDGNFDYDIKNGQIFFRMTSSFIDSMVSEEVFSYMLFCSCGTIDDYNDKFFMVSKGMMSIEQLIEFINR